jgi:hypothetical protein
MLASLKNSQITDNMLFSHRILIAIASIFATTLAEISSGPSTISEVNKDSNHGFKHPTLNILFSATLGGASHAIPLLAMGEGLVKRGHHVTFAAYDDDVQKRIPPGSGIQGLGVGKDPMGGQIFNELAMKYLYTDDDIDVLKVQQVLGDMILGTYADQFKRYRTWINEHHPDLFVCDMFAAPCIDAAYDAGVPFVVTTSMIDYQGFGSQPYLTNFLSYLPSTYEHLSFIDRLKDTFTELKMVIRFMPLILRQNAIMEELGIEPYSFTLHRWSKGLVLIYNYFGFEVPRQLPPNVYMIGPYLPRTYPPLKELADFMDQRQRVVYIGFGGQTILTKERITLILTSMLRAHRAGLLDGVVWGLMRLSSGDFLPESITLEGIQPGDPVEVHHIEDMRTGKHPIIRLLDRAPQRAILEHPSTKLFLSHGGIASIYETIHAGVPILGIPTFGDQPVNVIHMAEQGAGLWLRRGQVTETTLNETLTRLLDTEADIFTNNIKRMQRVLRLFDQDHDWALNLLEMAAVPGSMYMHQSADQRMPIWKARRYDVYAFIFIIFSLIVYTFIRSVRYIWIRYRVNGGKVTIARKKV